ncbi:MAG: hypothetical protein DMF72_12550 [Acidobacteria bacterium]|nr:MAG: hypothetical protein DMF72_12550 [Acidobacteriota bacterium]
MKYFSGEVFSPIPKAAAFTGLSEAEIQDLVKSGVLHSVFVKPGNILQVLLSDRVPKGQIQESRAYRAGALGVLTEEWETCRQKEHQDYRASQQRCIMCGEPLGFLNKTLKQTKHGSCVSFKY